MAFPVSWTGRQKITIDQTYVTGSADLTDFPMLIKDSNIPDAAYAAMQTGEVNAGSLLSNANLKAYYRFESGAETTDTTAGAHTLTAISDPAGGTGKFGGCVVLDGNDAYSVVDHADFKPTGNYSIGLWVKTSTTGADMELFQSYSQNTNVAGIRVKINTSNVIQFLTGKNTGTTVTTDWNLVNGTKNVCDNAWHHIVCTWDGSNLRLYVDGKLDAAAVAWANAPAYAATNYVRIGCYNASGTDQFFTTGSIDDLTVVNGTALSDAQIRSQYSGGADVRFTSDLAGTTELAFELVELDTTAKTAEIWVKIPTLSYNANTIIYMWYGNASATAYAVTDTYGARAAWKSAYTSVHHLKDATTSTVTDTTGTFNGTKSSANNPIEAAAKIGKGQTFTGDLINIGDGAGLDFGTGEFAVFAWANHDSVAAGTAYSLLGKIENSGNFDNFYMHTNTSGYANLSFKTGGVAYPATGAVDLTDGAWHRWVGVRRAAGIYIYIDGVLVGSNTNGATQNNEDNAEAFCIGSERSGTTASGWPGSIDEVFAWKGTAPTADWLTTEYNNQNDPATFLTMTNEPLASSNGSFFLMF